MLKKEVKKEDIIGQENQLIEGKKNSEEKLKEMKPSKK